MLNDADCGFCMRTAELVPRLGVDIDRTTVQAVDLAALGVDAERAVVEMPYVHPDGRVDYGHRAFAAILRTGPLPWRVVGRLMTAPGSTPWRATATTGSPPTGPGCPAARRRARSRPADRPPDELHRWSSREALTVPRGPTYGRGRARS